MPRMALMRTRPTAPTHRGVKVWFKSLRSEYTLYLV
eukprot:COSAG02_NODE_4907_length_4843_cov_5.587740_1_plen_36_part_00